MVQNAKAFKISTKCCCSCCFSVCIQAELRSVEDERGRCVLCGDQLIGQLNDGLTAAGSQARHLRTEMHRLQQNIVQTRANIAKYNVSLQVLQCTCLLFFVLLNAVYALRSFCQSVCQSACRSVCLSVCLYDLCPSSWLQKHKIVQHPSTPPAVASFDALANVVMMLLYVRRMCQ